ncbi:nucleoside deaminase [Okeania sp. SIO1I7]|uniref:nucleoside deaminase n=1 Tax=Okeania sp. SIO1I7 TaxID=2607772 RepID=UPI0013F8865D|nr:nucleoside deaminase [Okeania sp. SIO1I7]NET28095.1 nucleoside deaminase [Okeania sp. SIO1I7]
MSQSEPQDVVNSEGSVVQNADEAASIVLNQALSAAAQGTFAVGGAIVENATGRVIHKLHNNVLKKLLRTDSDTNNVFTYDPTAHGETQLVYWYYENKTKFNLPEPEELTIITTLDPCVMCTGALLTAGFNVGVIAIDDYAGINWDEDFNFQTLPESLRDLAKSKFGYYASENKDGGPSEYVRSYKGSPNVALRNTSISVQRLMGCDSIFRAGLESVRADSYDAGPDADKNLLDPYYLPEESLIKVKYREIYPDAFKVKISNPRLPGEELFQILKKVKESEPKAQNSVALLDQFGNVILCLADTDESPVHTAFMNVTQNYAIIRFELTKMYVNDPKKVEAPNKYLTYPKYGTFVFLYAPSPNSTKAIMTLGAYGSTLEGKVPKIFPANFQYYYPPHEGTIKELRSVIMHLPPFYNEFAPISIMQVAGDFT